MPPFADRLRERRKERGLSQDRLAEEMNTTQMQIWRYESGKVQPTADVVAALARYLEVSADYLLGLVDNPNETLKEESLSENERAVIQAMRSGVWSDVLELVAKELAREKRRSLGTGTVPEPTT